MAAVRQARAAGVAVTAEVTPHHLVLTEEAVGDYDTSFKVNPPLRTMADVVALRQGLADGAIDAVATDHAPHPPESKQVAFCDAAPGMVGLETALAIALTELALPVEKVLALMSWGCRHRRPVRSPRPACPARGARQPVRDRPRPPLDRPS